MIDAIKHGEFTFTEEFSDESKDLIRRILKVDPSQRITIQDIKSHVFFSDIDFENLSSMEAPLDKERFEKKNLMILL